MSLPINKTTFLSFLKLIQPRSEKFVWQTFTDSKAQSRQYQRAKVRDPLACSFIATPEEAIPRLQVLQDKGAGIFVQLNPGLGRGKANITGLAAYFLDTDGAPVEPIMETMPQPLGVTSSSEGNYHIYWRTEDSLENFRPTQKTLAQAFNCDEAMVNLDRVVRVPGSWHVKNPQNPVQVRFQACDERGVFTADDLLSYVGPRIGSAVPSPVTGATNINSGLITSGERFEMPDTLPEGGRTHVLVSYAGQLAAQGYGADYVKAEVKKAMLERLPAGQQPIPDHTMELEIYPAVEKFCAEATPTIPAVPQATAASWGVEVPEVPTPEFSQATRDAHELDCLDKFINQLYYVEKQRRIVHVRDDGRWRIHNLDEFKTGYGNIKRGDRIMTKAWLESPERTTVRDIQYHPGKDLIYNYRGHMMMNNYEGNDLKQIDEPHEAQLSKFFEHMKYLFPIQEDAGQFMKWLAVTVQKPATRVPWAPFLISEPGVGKGWIFALLQKLMGTQNCDTIGPKNIDDGFNEFLFEKTVLLIDEVKMSGRNQYDLVETLKPYITNPEISVNIKFGAKGTYPIFPNVICFSNHVNALAIKEDDRRFWVVKIAAHRREPEYYQSLFEWLGTDGPAHLHKWLSDLDLAGWSEQAPPPMTEAKRLMIDSFKSDIEKILDDAIEERVGPFVADVIQRDVIDIFVATKLSKDNLDNRDKNQIKNYILDKCAVSHDPNLHRVRCPYISDSDRFRYLEIIRRPEFWCFEDEESLLAEAKRSWSLSIGQEVGATLNMVKN